MAKAKLTEKVGYGFGDMSSSMFWKIFSYYLPIFYSDIFGLSLGATATLMLVTRIWDTVSDPMMGVIADRTQTRWGKYRPYLLWFAAPFAIAGILLFTTPDMSETGKLVWAYVTYILMMTVYTGINVPYGSMLGVMTNDSDEKTVFSSFRMFFAYAGSFLALFAWEPLCKFFEATGKTQQGAWQWAMIVIAVFCFLLFLACFRLTREHVHVEATPLGSDLKSLIHNAPWWLLTAAALCSNLFNTVRGATVAYYFKYYIGENANIDLGIVGFLFYAGLFLGVGEVCNMIGVVCAVPVSKRLGKRITFALACTGMAVLSMFFFYLPVSNGGFISMLLLQILISICTGIISPLIWSMYADVSDYATIKDGSSSTGLIFSSGSMAQKFGGAIAGSAVLWLFAAFGLVPNAVQQTETAILGMKLTMSWIPAAIAILMVIIMVAYPLGKGKMKDIGEKLKELRKMEG
ncbi:MFS transporter [Prevotella sp. KH2C16]|uniref:MFS transporter n=1 Tax=Prevotella sp. KH2C16 TaxID=1855325 RepID=UPI0008F01D5E|nr:MFS transporter [Prevotella sp. KH2C16]SFG33632.1 glycoside/pentoside/hexuronide:cation symporter, GPH family [Prevotella sp. KH2C16]